MPGGEENQDGSLGGIVDRLVTDGRAAIDAELRVLRAIAAWRLSGLKWGVPLLILALFLAQGAVAALLVGLVLALAPIAGPAWATLVVVISTVLVIAMLGWAGIRRCRTLVAPLPEEEP